MKTKHHTIWKQGSRKAIKTSVEGESPKQQAKEEKEEEIKFGEESDIEKSSVLNKEHQNKISALASEFKSSSSQKASIP